MKKIIYVIVIAGIVFILFLKADSKKSFRRGNIVQKNANPENHVVKTFESREATEKNKINSQHQTVEKEDRLITDINITYSGKIAISSDCNPFSFTISSAHNFNSLISTEQSSNLTFFTDSECHEELGSNKEFTSNNENTLYFKSIKNAETNLILEIPHTKIRSQINIKTIGEDEFLSQISPTLNGPQNIPINICNGPFQYGLNFPGGDLNISDKAYSNFKIESKAGLNLFADSSCTQMKSQILPFETLGAGHFYVRPDTNLGSLIFLYKQTVIKTFELDIILDLKAKKEKLENLLKKIPRYKLSDKEIKPRLELWNSMKEGNTQHISDTVKEAVLDSLISAIEKNS